MAFQGHPILADIRKGFKLRPTTTVDKSGPVIVGEDEELPTIQFVKPEKPADLSYLYIKKPDPEDIVVWRPRSIVPPPIIHKGKAVDGPIVHSRPTTPNPPNGNSTLKPGLLKLGGTQQDVDRAALLNSIKGGVKLKKTVTKDRSGLILDDEYLEEIKNRPTTPIMMSEGQTNGVISPKQVDEPVQEAKPKKILRRKSSNAKPKSPSTPKNFVPAKPIGNAPPPPPPPPMATMPLNFATPAPIYNRQNNVVPPPPPMPPPAPPVMPTSATFPPPSMPNKCTPSAISKPSAPIQEPKKSDIVFDEKNLYVTKESLDAEIKKGSASSRIAMFKQFEQKDNYIPLPKSSYPPIQTGKLKIIENAPKEKPKEVPITNGRLKIHEVPIKSSTKVKKQESLENDVTATFTLPTVKYTVPITVKTDQPPLTSETSPKKIPKKLSNGKLRKTSIKPKTTENTLSPASTRCDSLSPNSSSAYQSGVSSPNSVSSISPKSKSSGISSISSVSPPIRTSSINGNVQEKEKSPPVWNPKTRSITSERFAKLRQSFSEKPNFEPELTKNTAELVRPLKKADDSGEQFWKNALSKSNGVPSTPKATPVEIKTPWSPSTPVKTTLTLKKPPPPVVPPKKAVPISIRLKNEYSTNTNSYDSPSLRQYYVEIVHR